MKIKYVFQNGEEIDVEVSEEIGNIILDSRREEENLARKERYHCYSLDAAEFEGEDYADPDTPETVLLSRLEEKHIAETLDGLSEVQRRRLQLLAQGRSGRLPAGKAGISRRSGSQSKARRKNL